MSRPQAYLGGKEDMKVPVEAGKVILCPHPGCQEKGLPCYSGTGDEESNGSYCFEHCQVHGFCYRCDLSCGGIEFVNFNNVLFVNRRECLEPEFEEEEDDFDGRTLDERVEHEESLKYYRGVIPKEVSHYDPFPEKISEMLLMKGEIT